MNMYKPTLGECVQYAISIVAWMEVVWCEFATIGMKGLSLNLNASLLKCVHELECVCTRFLTQASTEKIGSSGASAHPLQTGCRVAWMILA